MSDATKLLPPPAEPGQLVPQPHGGALRQGGNPGNRGRPPSVIREVLRKDFATMCRELRMIARGFDPRAKPEKGKPREATISIPDRLKALDLMAKYGMGVPVEVGGPDGSPFTVLVGAAAVVNGDD